MTTGPEQTKPLIMRASKGAFFVRVIKSIFAFGIHPHRKQTRQTQSSSSQDGGAEILEGQRQMSPSEERDIAHTETDTLLSSYVAGNQIVNQMTFALCRFVFRSFRACDLCFPAAKGIVSVRVVSSLSRFDFRLSSRAGNGLTRRHYLHGSRPLVQIELTAETKPLRLTTTISKDVTVSNLEN